MVLLKNFRQIKQNPDGISFRLNFEDWPTDAPFPPQTGLASFGENHDLFIYPEWQFAFQPDGVYEIWSGIFRVPLSFDETVAWYRSELKKLDWVEFSDYAYVTESSGGLKFFRPDTTTRLSFSLLRGDSSLGTRITAWRVTKHPLPSAVESIPDSQLALPIAEEAIR